MKICLVVSSFKDGTQNVYITTRFDYSEILDRECQKLNIDDVIVYYVPLVLEEIEKWEAPRESDY